MNITHEQLLRRLDLAHNKRGVSLFGDAAEVIRDQGRQIAALQVSEGGLSKTVSETTETANLLVAQLREAMLEAIRSGETTPFVSCILRQALRGSEK